MQERMACIKSNGDMNLPKSGSRSRIRLTANGRCLCTPQAASTDDAPGCNAQMFLRSLRSRTHVELSCEPDRLSCDNHLRQIISTASVLPLHYFDLDAYQDSRTSNNEAAAMASLPFVTIASRLSSSRRSESRSDSRMDSCASICRGCMFSAAEHQHSTEYHASSTAAHALPASLYRPTEGPRRLQCFRVWPERPNTASHHSLSLIARSTSSNI